MNCCELVNRTEEILEDARAGVMACVDDEGRPTLRWMTPAFLDGYEGVLFSVAAPESTKICHIKDKCHVEWMIQNPSLTEVVNLRGYVNILDNPSIKCQVMEKLARRLTVFWKVNLEETDFVVLETVIEEGEYFRPMKGIRETIKFI